MGSPEPAKWNQSHLDLAAAGVALRALHNMPVVAEAVEREQPEHLRAEPRRLLYRLASAITIPDSLTVKLKIKYHNVTLPYMQTTTL
ncbi:hypothetical protein KCP71_17515 [Salmonella enterica subsp. enterica]|nr:hypothetical protein KCP71_17515 [Salmonella enterica subsp. enterica]